jgi:type VI secretion system secreted protein VgrG
MAAAFTQTGRPMQVTTPAGTDVLLLEGLSVHESVSEPFEITLDLLSTNAKIDPDTMLRKAITVTLELQGGGERYFHGFVSRFAQGGRGDQFVSYRAEVVPALWFLNLVSDCRVFQNMSVPDIVQKVLNDSGLTDVKTNLVGAYSPREYCVQYRESNFTFISRLMEEEGIFYFFEHAKDKHTLVIADNTGAAEPGPVGKLKVAFADAETAEQGDIIDQFEMLSVVRPGKVTLADYTDLQTKRLEGTSTAAAPKASAKGLALYDYPGKFGAVAGGERYAKLRLEAEEAMARVVSGHTNCRGLVSGHKLDVVEHYRSDLNDSYHILTLSTVARITNYGSTTAGVSAGETFRFDAQFTAMPASVVYRPPQRTPKSLVYGTQTAAVVGPKGEEIYVDKYGRVKVQFFWDRLGKNDEKSSCWVRVSSAWAGKGWGAIHVPRIGQEVVVDFLEGDPDRPIITGRVYNSEQVVPYELPANGTQSGIKSHSSKQGEVANTNELRFEDKKGSEQIYVHAEKDLSTIVLNDETRDVQHDRTTTIKNDETKTVTEGNEATTIEKGNRSIKVTKGNQEVVIAEGDETYTIAKGKQTVEIDKDRSVTIKTGNESLHVKTGNVTTTVDQGNVDHMVKMGNVTHAVKMGNVDHKIDMGNLVTKLGLGASKTEALQGIELKVGQSSIKIDQMGVTIKGMMIKIEGQVQTEVKGLMTTVNGSAMLTVKGAITMIN